MKKINAITIAEKPPRPSDPRQALHPLASADFAATSSRGGEAAILGANSHSQAQFASKIKISPSFLTADFCDIKGTIRKLENGGADYIHLDVMDGAFVPNISYGAKMAEDIRKITRLPLDVHLMVKNPKNFIKDFAAAGSDIITVHLEATSDIAADLNMIESYNKKCGIALSPDTPVSAAEGIIYLCDIVLVMSVYPGFGGQRFIPSTIDKIKRLKQIIGGLNKKIEIEVDGGITLENSKDIIGAGADILVSGSFIINAKDKKTAIEGLRDFL
jgi:ribulose-phosphate 3-epimerase